MIEVTAAFIEEGNKIMLARRAHGKYLAGYWEFPGGKIEPEETPENCLSRELKEEFEIVAKIKWETLVTDTKLQPRYFSAKD